MTRLTLAITAALSFLVVTTLPANNEAGETYVDVAAPFYPE
jgi:hypothetical protein